VAHAEGLRRPTRAALAKEGKGRGLDRRRAARHRILGAAQLIETSYQLVSRKTRKRGDSRRPTSPAGAREPRTGCSSCRAGTCASRTHEAQHELPRPLPEVCGARQQPRLLYVQPAESQNLNHVLYWEWFRRSCTSSPDRPVGTVMFAPPFRDTVQLQLRSTRSRRARSGRRLDAQPLRAEGKPGVTMRSARRTRRGGTAVSARPCISTTWIGLLTESIGNPTPSAFRSCRANQLPRRWTSHSLSRHRSGTSAVGGLLTHRDWAVARRRFALSRDVPFTSGGWE